MKQKNKLDEMQEQKLLKIEHNGVWLAFWGLLLMIIIQTIAGRGNALQYMAGEFIIFMALSIYLLAACLKNGIWDRRLAPNLRTNFMIIGFLHDDVYPYPDNVCPVCYCCGV